jgi:hypothetical protein
MSARSFGVRTRLRGTWPDRMDGLGDQTSPHVVTGDVTCATKRLAGRRLAPCLEPGGTGGVGLVYSSPRSRAR